MEIGRFILILAVISLSFIGATYILYFFFKQMKILKYTPSIILLFMAVYNLYLSQTSNQGFEDIARLLIFIMFLVGSLSGIITGLILDYRIAKKDPRDVPKKR